jgi:hypothetical protein
MRIVMANSREWMSFSLSCLESKPFDILQQERSGLGLAELASMLRVWLPEDHQTPRVPWPRIQFREGWHGGPPINASAFRPRANIQDLSCRNRNIGRSQATIDVAKRRAASLVSSATAVRNPAASNPKSRPPAPVNRLIAVSSFIA